MLLILISCCATGNKQESKNSFLIDPTGSGIGKIYGAANTVIRKIKTNRTLDFYILNFDCLIKKHDLIFYEGKTEIYSRAIVKSNFTINIEMFQDKHYSAAIVEPITGRMLVKKPIDKSQRYVMEPKCDTHQRGKISQ